MSAKQWLFVRFSPFLGTLLKFTKKVRNFPVLYTFVSAQIEMVPQNHQNLESEDHIKLMEKLIEIMEEDDDVQNIWHNWDQE